MAVYSNAGGGGGVSSDEVTAKREDVLKGKTAVTSDSNDEAGMGTLELTGNAAAGNVKKGETFYTTDPKSKQTGTLEEKTGQYAATSSLDTGNKRVRLDVPGRAIYGDSALLYDTFANIASRIGLTAAKLAQGQSVLGVTGTYKGRGNATQGHVRKGIYFSSASLDNAVGTMAEKGAQTFTPGRSNQSVGANQFLTGAQTILGDANLLAANIRGRTEAGKLVLVAKKQPEQEIVIDDTKLNVQCKTNVTSTYLALNGADGTSNEVGSLRIDNKKDVEVTVSFNISAVGSLSTLGLRSNGNKFEFYRIWTS